MKLVANGETIIDNTLSEEAVKSMAEVDDVLDLSYDIFANVKINHKCIELAKQIMKNHGVDSAKLYLTNSYFKKPSTEDFELSI
jgi:hypothetical protein